MATKPSIDDLLVWWNLGESSGNRQSAYGNYLLSDYNTVGSALGGAEFIDANEEFLYSTDGDLRLGNAQSMSIFAWAYMYDKDQDNTITSRWDGASLGNSNHWLYYDISAGAWKFTVRRSVGVTNTVSEGANGAINTWHSVCARHYYDPGTGNIYLRVDGSDNSGNGVDGTLDYNSSVEFRIGATDTFSPGSRFMSGVLKNVSIWNTLLSTDEMDFLEAQGETYDFSQFAGVGGWQIWYSKIRKRFDDLLNERQQIYNRLYQKGAIAI